MLSLDHTGIPGLVCGRCGQPIPVNEALALKFRDLTSVQFACVDCAEKIKKGFPDVRFMLARDYFEALLAPGRPKHLFPADRAFGEGRRWQNAVLLVWTQWPRLWG
jgi:hypothetical protein